MLKIKKMVCVLGLIGTIIAGLSSPVFAVVIYDQGLSDTDNYGFISNIGGDLSADNFVVTDDTVLQLMTWYGMYGAAGAGTVDSFDIQIFDMAGTELFGKSYVSNIDKSYSGFDDAYGEMIYQYQVSVSDWAVSAGSYLLSISNSNTYFSEWYWADGLGGDGASYYFDSGAWVAEYIGIDMAFTLEGEQAVAPAPEPSTFVLFAFGTLGMAALGRRVKA
ncbi:PEP-CTERM sorting domain-containing protein [Desulfobacter postgatei]|uniref:PEP-CTERM putative exosortase interaction domain-containing protein n=1 Tax=Desulfobacter postgatei 2ac9 TaxID=879212 RepID=I5B633_9BACT|nr:PEP-CTERM sorting domain-containing protein [Desulfobacter postgatei]EIM64946.1 PEP-CTERM putative exosortase interaction domain-containing protein [Desulfobacter postgatei 2ac9]